MTSVHAYACPLRWGDLDMLGHTNNVRYLDYVQEARIELLRDAGLDVSGGLAGRDRVLVTRHDVSFDAPLMFRESAVRVESVVVEVTAATVVTEHVVLDRPGEGALGPDATRPRVYFRARTEICLLAASTGQPRRLTDEEAAALEQFRGPGQEPSLRGGLPEPAVPGTSTAYETRVRWTDVDGYGHVGNVTFVEYLQEARLRMLGLERWSGHGDADGAGDGFDNMLVVARTGLAYARPMFFRLEPYAVHSWVSRIGGASFDVDSVVMDPLAGPDHAPLARGRVTLVGFDPQAQRSAPLTDRSRSVLQRLHC